MNTKKISVLAIPGTRYGRWTVIGELEPTTKEHFTKVRCDCGNEKIVRYGNLKNGTSKSCGCLVKEHLEWKNYRHGATVRGKMERLYRIWNGIKVRCYDKNDPAYPKYGGRGILMCNEWHYDYLKFKEWALNNGYSDELSIDRIDNDKGYYPENCRWADSVTQMNNRSFNHKVTYNGETHTLAEWERITGIKQEKIRHRLKSGLSIEQAFFNGDLRKKVI